MHSRFNKDVEQIEKAHRRATKLVTSLRDMSYQERLQSLDLVSLVYRRYRGDMIEQYLFTIFTSLDTACCQWHLRQH